MSYQKFVSAADYVYRGFWKEYGADCVDHLPLVSEGPWKVLFIVGVYLWFVKIKGPQMMKNREPIDIKNYILAYNIFLVLLHALLFPVALWATNFFESTWQCKKLNLIDPEDLLKENISVLLGYTYFITKFLEMLDTVFFILRKKDTHVSGLHVFHHSIMPVFCYIGAKFSPWHPIGWIAMLNAFVHIVMYSYYTLALLEVKKLLWLKKHITQLQIAQFLLILVHGAYFLQSKSCEWPKIFPFLQIVHGLQFLYLFGSFYYRSYVKTPAKKLKDH